jgi:cardiolipin synthase
MEKPLTATSPSALPTTSHGAPSRPADEGWINPPPVQLQDGTYLQLYKDGSALKAAYDAIQGAKRRICLEVYVFRSDATGTAFAELLAQKALEGVRVFVIHDSFGSWDSNPAMFELMKSAGVQLRAFHPILPWESKFGWRPINRDHRKMLVIDDHLAGLGGLNIGAEYAGSSVVESETCERWRDTGIGIAGPGARHLMAAFHKTWKYIYSGGRISRTQLIHDIDNAELGLLASAPTLNSPLRPFLNRLFRGAQRSIDLTMAYFAPDDDLIDSLCRAARRGVRVRLMLPGNCDMPFLQTAARSFYETLLNCGVQIYEREGVVLHAKTIVIDQRIGIMGSSNLDYRSIEYNLEVSVVIRNPQFAKQMRSLFQHDMKFAKRIMLSDWRYRPTLDRLVQWAVSRARYLM